jgi:ketosteroid isomerase-like protein
MNISRSWSFLLPLVLLAFSADGASAASPGATTPPSREARPDPFAEPGDTVVRFLAALRAGDYETVLGLLDPQVIVYESGSVEHSRDEYAAHHMKADAEFLQSATDTVLSNNGASDADFAWVATESRVTVRGEQPHESIGTETMVLRRSAEGWRIVHIHWSSRKAPAT